MWVTSATEYYRRLIYYMWTESWSNRHGRSCTKLHVNCKCLVHYTTPCIGPDYEMSSASPYGLVCTDRSLYKLHIWGNIPPSVRVLIIDNPVVRQKGQDHSFWIRDALSLTRSFGVWMLTAYFCHCEIITNSKTHAWVLKACKTALLMLRISLIARVQAGSCVWLSATDLFVYLVKALIISSGVCVCVCAGVSDVWSAKSGHAQPEGGEATPAGWRSAWPGSRWRSSPRSAASSAYYYYSAVVVWWRWSDVTSGCQEKNSHSVE